ncbi:hypothetical protein KO465_03005 [Candidatus Micrarchaeota archaeon]|jgi:hypothetical protein|nr:hypothetical protein [Candidatus Micrarchaeota archaeon]
MNNGNETYDAVNKAWKSTCKLLFGGEIGNLKEYEKWLSEHVEPIRKEKDSNSKDVYLAIQDYCSSAKFTNMADVNFWAKFTPLDINQIKDIDSIVDAVHDRTGYTGSVVLGNSKAVNRSSNVTDSFNVYDAAKVSDSKNIAYANLIRYDENVFGIFEAGESGHLIRCDMSWRLKRGFNTFMTFESQDCYYTVRTSNCSDCMFSFGINSKKYAIGNLELPKDKYLQLKAKLLAEIREKLKRDKRIFSVLDIIANAGTPTIKLAPNANKPRFDIKPINDAFNQTTSIVFGTKLGDINQYSKYLLKHIDPTYTLKSPLSDEVIYAPGCLYKFKDIHHGLEKRIIPEEEILQIGNTSVDEDDIKNISIDLGTISKALSKIAFCTMDAKPGNNINVSEAAIMADAIDCYHGYDFTKSKRCAYDFWPRNSEYVFGSSVTWSSQFCLNCYYSKKLTRCFQVDSCDNCSDLYYSHNCENVHDSMFCFNVKNLRNAIGNAVLPSEEYKKIKQMVLAQIADELETKKDLKWDIYNIGCAKSK